MTEYLCRPGVVAGENAWITKAVLPPASRDLKRNTKSTAVKSAYKVLRFTLPGSPAPNFVGARRSARTTCNLPRSARPRRDQPNGPLAAQGPPPKGPHGADDVQSRTYSRAQRKALGQSAAPCALKAPHAFGFEHQA